jgi:signal peptidase I
MGTAEPRSKLPVIAGTVAALSAVVLTAQALRGPLIALPLALIPAIAAMGIFRRVIWSSYGLVLNQFAGLAILALVSARGEAGVASTIVSTGISSFLLALLFFFSGKAPAREGGRRGHPLPWIIVAFIPLLPFLFLVAYAMPTGSMEPPLLPGDKILVRVAPTPAVERGTVVVFHYPVDRKQTFVKRVVGVAGDRIKISNKALFRDGVRVTEPYVIHALDYTDAYRDNFPNGPQDLIFPPAVETLQKHLQNGEVVVPAGKYFVLGDNRDQSLDSRYWGFVDQSEIIGVPVMIYDSAEQSGEQPAASSLLTPRKTRWSRLFKFL